MPLPDDKQDKAHFLEFATVLEQKLQIVDVDGKGKFDQAGFLTALHFMNVDDLDDHQVPVNR